ncbi:MAG TPA: hypothetical protein VFX98_10750 [Longimicrobiaceae bacterium]|nr:hypothetical protein [Longimicrobiaceae bacterium]
MKTIRTLALAALLAPCAAPAAAQAATDQGTFRVYVEGREVGTEEFSIRQSGSGSSAEFVATGRVSLRLPTGSLELTPRLRAAGVQADPTAYQVDVGGDSPRKIVGTIGEGRVSAKIVTASGEQLREYVASQGAVVLDEGVAHHYFFLAQRVRSGRVPVIVPRENRQVIATVTDRGQESVQIGSQAVMLYHLVVQPAGGGEQHVWVDALNRVLKVEIPQRGYLAVRTEIPR